ncbi:hypothetical protein SeMB42_g02480 [Synchytrium endobioticum]|uniref:RING-type domain-containing protein n=1 Tax=Synchytrium endobioticum TaxID=286115 RepID=A0A507DEL9_9FUNG|nr:hypothetical protein SeLEV6574_g03586 [Synchytrium endobioticum]TPX49765.1 hypothetical protein SeMB42_g02480 [Synchytrium endobioticum]
MPTIDSIIDGSDHEENESSRRLVLLLLERVGRQFDSTPDVHTANEPDPAQGVEVLFELTVTLRQLLQSIGLYHTGPPAASQPAIDALISPAVLSPRRIHSDCPVCMDTIRTGVQPKAHMDGYDSRATFMPCKHFFHNSCLTTWLRSHNTCPVCRFELEVDNPEYSRLVRDRMARRSVALDAEIDEYMIEEGRLPPRRSARLRSRIEITATCNSVSGFVPLTLPSPPARPRPVPVLPPQPSLRPLAETSQSEQGRRYTRSHSSRPSLISSPQPSSSSLVSNSNGITADSNESFQRPRKRPRRQY